MVWPSVQGTCSSKLSAPGQREHLRPNRAQRLVATALTLGKVIDEDRDDNQAPGANQLRLGANSVQLEGAMNRRLWTAFFARLCYLPLAVIYGLAG
jgi:hypothetical protein